MESKLHLIKEILSQVKNEINSINILQSINPFVEIWSTRKIEDFNFIDLDDTATRYATQLKKILSEIDVSELEKIIKNNTTTLKFVKRSSSNITQLIFSTDSTQLSLYIYDKEQQVQELNNFIKKHSLSNEAADELFELFEDVEPPYKTLSNVIEMLKEIIIQLFSTSDFSDFVYNKGYSFKDLNDCDLSSEILDLINVSYLQIFREHLSIRKCANGYELLLFDECIQRICYEIKLYFQDNLAI